MGKSIGYYWSAIRGIVKSSVYAPLRKLQFKNFGFSSFIERGGRFVGGGQISIGSHVYIEHGAKLWAVKQYGNKEYSPTVIIEDNVRIAQNFHCTCAEKVEIKRGVSITANCGIFDITHPYDQIDINPRVADILTDPVIIGEDCMIGMNSTILPGARLGKHCVVGANSVVRKGSYADYSVLAGVPARIVKQYDPIKKSWERPQTNG